MEKINLTKYGFQRCKEEDFNDDGTRFTCYSVGKVRVSKAVHQGDAYISARIDGQLPYEVYCKLGHYRDLDKLNGVEACCIKEEDLKKLYDDCVAYEKEYDQALNYFEFPSLEEIKKKKEELVKVYENQLNEIKEKGKEKFDKFLNISLEEFKSFKRYYSYLQDECEGVKLRAESYFKTAYSIDFVKREPNTYYYKNCMEILESI